MYAVSPRVHDKESDVAILKIVIVLILRCRFIIGPRVVQIECADGSRERSDVISSPTIVVDNFMIIVDLEDRYEEENIRSEGRRVMQSVRSRSYILRKLLLL